MEEITGFSMKNYLGAPGLRWECFKSSETEEGELK